ncbi:AEC family transporter [Polaromonas sp.]|uniref:AEC family transporter n=1 Tax=Polaromonas sp. TaxID=1869339 RepID=UPI002487D437|nr:AEC family transporter [Polaromonas sp.]MDI1339255.1 AEC family transporter [Polaromonas sp.]
MLGKIAEITLPIFIIALAGFFYARATKPDLSGANRIIVDLALPALIFTSLSVQEFSLHSAGYFVLGAVLLVLLSGLAILPLVKFSGTGWRALLPCAMFGNVGPVGIPMTVLAYGQAGLGPAVLLLVLSNILHFTVGAWVMSGRMEARSVYANPLIWATALGLLASTLHLKLPHWLAVPLTMTGSVLVPMMLLSLGARLGESRVTQARIGVYGAAITVPVRLAVAWGLTRFLPVDEVQRGALVLFAALPPAVFNYMLADRFGREPDKVASIVIAGHFACVIFLPLAIWLAFL